MSDDRYVRVEDWRVMDRSAVSNAAFRFYCHMRSFCRNDSTVRATPAQLAVSYGVGLAHAHRIIKQLGKAGWAAVDYSGKTWHIVLDDPPGASPRRRSRIAYKAMPHRLLGDAHIRSTTRPQDHNTVLSLEKQERRVIELVGKTRGWESGHFAHGFLDSCQKQIALGDELTPKQDLCLDRLEREAASDPGDRIQAMAERSRREREERERLRDRAREERGGV